VSAASGARSWQPATAADLTAWTRLLGLRDDEDLCDADPDTLGQVCYWLADRAGRTY
jgi:hypothetical protein